MHTSKRCQAGRGGTTATEGRRTGAAARERARGAGSATEAPLGEQEAAGAEIVGGSKRTSWVRAGPPPP
eukprot:1865571-Pyramimonas_sp.AAC.1